MEVLEQEVIATALMECRPRYWKRCHLQITQGETDNLPEHTNKEDKTNNIKFRHKEELEDKIPFLDTLISMKEDGIVKLVIYRRKTRNEQYQNFKSHHPLHQ